MQYYLYFCHGEAVETSGTTMFLTAAVQYISQYSSRHIIDFWLIMDAKKCISTPGGHYKQTLSFDLLDAVRNLIVIEKVKPTSNTYPRGLNKPKLKPIK